MSSYRTARVPDLIIDDTTERPLYFQWHHGTNMRGDALADGGWECEVGKYPGLSLALPKGHVQHSSNSILAWYATELDVAVLATDLRWFTGPHGEPVEVKDYVTGAWSRLRALAWVKQINRPAVLTLRSSAAQDFANALKAFRLGPLAFARRNAPNLPLCAFWLTVFPGERDRRGQGSAASFVTPPLIQAPSDPDDETALDAWLESRFVGEALLDRFASLPELAKFKQRAAPEPPEPTPTGNGNRLAQSAPGYVEQEPPPEDDAKQRARNLANQFYAEAQAMGMSAQATTELVVEAGGDYGKALEAMYDELGYMPEGDPPEAARAAPPQDGNDGEFDKLKSATEDPVVKELLTKQVVQKGKDFPLCEWCGEVYSSPGVPCRGCQELGASVDNRPGQPSANKEPRMGWPRPEGQPAAPQAPTSPASVTRTDGEDRDILDFIWNLLPLYKDEQGEASKELYGLWCGMVEQTLVKLGMGGIDNGRTTRRAVTARIANTTPEHMTQDWRPGKRACKAWLHWLAVKNPETHMPVRPYAVSKPAAEQLKIIAQEAMKQFSEDEAPQF